MHRLIIASLVVLPVTVFAADAFDFLAKDMEMLQEDMERMQQMRDQQVEEEEFQSSVDLFPGTGKESTVKKQVSTGDGTHVRIMVGSTEVTLEDVPREQWFARYVEDMAERRIITGYKDAAGNPLGVFGPADQVTVEQLAKIVVQAARVDQSVCPAVPMNDAAANSWSAQFIACAEELGWQVFSDGSVNPARAALRFEVVTTVLEAFGRDLMPATGTMFRDVSNTMPARYAIETAATDGIVSGYTDAKGQLTGQFGPFDTVNRAETAKVVSLAIATYGE